MHTWIRPVHVLPVIALQNVCLLLQFKEPMIVLLLASGLVSICMGQYDDAVSISVVSRNFFFFPDSRIFISIDFLWSRVKRDLALACKLFY